MNLRTFYRTLLSDSEVADEIANQVVICAELGKPLSAEKIAELLKSKTTTEVIRKVHDIKIS